MTDRWEPVRKAYMYFMFAVMILTPIAGFAFLLWDTKN